MIPALIWKEDQWIDEKKQDIININNFLRREKKVEKKAARKVVFLEGSCDIYGFY